MILISEESLETEILSLWNNEEDFKDVNVKLGDVMQKLYGAKQVEAIPIEWLTQRIEELEAELHSLYLRFSFEKDSKEKGEALLRCVELRTPLTAYETVLSEWRKENEVQRSED